MTFNPTGETMTPQSRYSTVAILLHWTLAVLLVIVVGLAWTADEVDRETRMALMGLHKPIGILIMLLSLVRLGWRLTHRPPALNPDLKAREKALATLVHWGFYALLIIMPLTGWAMSSGGRPIDMFGLFEWPALGFITGLEPEARETAREAFGEAHHLLAKAIIYVLVPLHVLGALKHQFLDKDNALARMLPFLARKGAA